MVDLEERQNCSAVGSRYEIGTHDPSDTDSTRGARAEVAGAARGILSPLVEPCGIIC